MFKHFFAFNVFLLLIPSILLSMDPELSPKEKRLLALRNRISELPAELQCKIADYTIDPLVRSYLLTELTNKKTLPPEPTDLYVSIAAYSADGKYIAVKNSVLQSISVYDIQTMRRIKTVLLSYNGFGSIQNITFHPTNSNGLMIVTEKLFGLLSLDSEDWGTVKFSSSSRNLSNPDREIHFRHDGSSVLYSDEQYNTITATTNSIIGELSSSGICETNFGPIPHNLAYPYDKKKTIRAICPGENPKILFCDNDTPPMVTIYDLVTKNVLGSFTMTDCIKKAVFSHDGTKIITISDRNKTALWDAVSCKKIFDMDPHAHPHHHLPSCTYYADEGYNDIAFSPDDKHVCAVRTLVRRCFEYRRVVSIWDIEAQKELFSFTPPETHASFINPSCSKLLTTPKRECDTKTWNEWDVEHMKQLNRTLNDMTIDQQELLQGFGQAMRDKGLIHPTPKQWETFQSLEQFQEPLKKFIQNPNTNNNN